MLKRLKTHLTFLCSFILVAHVYSAQYQGIILDSQSHKAIPYVSIHTSNNNDIYGSMSNDLGEFSISFDFDSLVFQHINYTPYILKKQSYKDTLYLNPLSYTLNEIDVYATESLWIRKKLHLVVKNKKKFYTLPSSIQQDYVYNTYTLSDSSGYAFESKGILQSNKNEYSILPILSAIKYKDSTAGTDFSNLRRMLHDDFLPRFTSNFIKNNSFRENKGFRHSNPNVVQLFYFSNDKLSDDGYLVIDTLKNVILEAQQNLGTQSNIENNTSSLLRKVAESRGFTYNDWITQTQYIYTEINGSYLLQFCSYKLYMHTTTDNKKESNSYFVSTESTVRLSNPTLTNSVSNSKQFLILPKPYYIVPIYTKTMREEEEKLQRIKRTYKKF